MSANFDPRFDILPESQLRLWPELNAAPSGFILYGGTGLALKLAARHAETVELKDPVPDAENRARLDGAAQAIHRVISILTQARA